MPQRTASLNTFNFQRSTSSARLISTQGSLAGPSIRAVEALKHPA
jgi:hypothetical protein